ncbi:PDGLE domain-containing protein [Candidatus Lokiarchaeum ossiferum]|uniref:PDGLE domain-containing protein n=1 Tax=Candidatus Lokiarchaeum ossiferum TaxID=2951803 RepID=UPI00352D497F
MKKQYKFTLITFGLTMVVLAAFLWSPLFLAGPDGLEKSLFDLTDNNEWEPESDVNYDGSPLADYEFAGGENGYFQSWFVGLIGSVLTFVVIFGLTKLVTYKKKKSIPNQTTEVVQKV